jgi:hypothetical protein
VRFPDKPASRPALPRIRPSSGGPKPPPTRSRISDSRIKPRLPCLCWINLTDQTMKAKENSTVRKPDRSRLGITVMAGSPLKSSKAGEPGQDWITSPSGRVLPCSISPMPCSIPATPARTPKVEMDTRTASLIYASFLSVLHSRATVNGTPTALQPPAPLRTPAFNCPRNVLVEQEIQQEARRKLIVDSSGINCYNNLSNSSSRTIYPSIHPAQNIIRREP